MVLIIGYASGITAGAVGRHEVKRIDCVEIEPAMREASAFFAEENYHIIDDRRFNLIVDDARSCVHAARKKYDVIISEPSNPWQAGSSRLFTREAFVNARNSLNKGGVMVQWMHLYGVDVETFRLVVRTFMSVFPHVSLWADPNYPDVFFLGSAEPIKINPVALNALFEPGSKVGSSLARIGYPDAASLFNAFLLDEAGARRFAQSGDMNTDNLPLLEYRAPRSLYSSTALRDNVRALLESREPESFPDMATTKGEEIRAAALLKDWGKSLAERRAISTAKGAFLRAAEINPADGEAYYLHALIRMQTGDRPGAIQSFERAVAHSSNLGVAYSNLGMLYLQTGDMAKAEDNLKKAIAVGEDSSTLRNNLAVVQAKSGRMAAAIREENHALALDPTNRVARDNLEHFRKLLEQ